MFKGCGHQAAFKLWGSQLHSTAVHPPPPPTSAMNLRVRHSVSVMRPPSRTSSCISYA
jgi:hypothetical protein